MFGFKKRMTLDEQRKQNYDRFWKWMKVPLMDVPYEELIWCSEQSELNSYCSLQGWKSEIERRKKLDLI